MQIQESNHATYGPSHTPRPSHELSGTVGSAARQNRRRCRGIRRRPGGKMDEVTTGGWAYAGDQLQFLTLVAAGSATGAATGAEAVAPQLALLRRCLPNVPSGADMTPNDAYGPRTSQTAYEYFTRSGRFAAAPKWNSSVSNVPRVIPPSTPDLRFLQRPSLPGKLVIYGFSAGGFNAVRLCESIARVGQHVDTSHYRGSVRTGRRAERAVSNTGRRATCGRAFQLVPNERGRSTIAAVLSGREEPHRNLHP